MDLYLKITETVYIVFVLVVTLSSLAIPEGDDNGYNTVTMTALSPFAVSPDSDTTNDYESPQSDVVRTYFEPCMVLGQHSHDDSFVAIGGVTRQRHDQWLRKPSVRRCTDVFRTLYGVRSRWQLCRHWRCHETATRTVITKAPSSTTLSSLAIPEGNGIPNHQRIVTLTIIRCINVGVFMDLYFKITKFYIVCVLATT